MLAAIHVVDDAHGLVRRGEKSLGRFYPNGLPRTGDFVFPRAGLGDDAVGHGFFVNPPGLEPLVPADLKEGNIERLMGNIDQIQFHVFQLIGVMDMDAMLLDRI